MDPCYSIVESPVGRLLLLADAEGLIEIRFDRERDALAIAPSWVEGSDLLEQAAAALGEYFAGERREFDLPLAPRGTPFQLDVWRELQRIPYGRTISYGELARRIGKPAASRAVGAANGKNPLPIVIPCHRVIGADGSLTGFGGGLPVKRKLLALEGGAGAIGGRRDPELHLTDL